MPQKIDSCVNKVQKKTGDKSQAYAICSKSTGYVKISAHEWAKKKQQAKRGI